MDLPLDPRLVGWRGQSKPSDLHEEVRFAADLYGAFPVKGLFFP